MFKKFLTLALVAALALTGCKKEGKIPTPTPEPPGKETEASFSDVTPSSSEIKYDSTKDKLSVTFQQKEGTASFKLTADDSWTISAVNTKADSWVSIAPTSGTKGSTTINIQTKQNDTYDERSAEFQFVCGKTKKVIRVDQKQKDALILSDSKVEVSAEGGNFKIEVQHNVSFTVKISPDATWIKQVKTKGLVKESLVFDVDAYDGTTSREGEITISSDIKTETVRVIQRGSSAELVISKKEYTVDSKQQQIDVFVTSNVNVNAKVITGSDWIKEVKSKSTSTDKFVFEISENTSYDSREGVIKFYTDDGSLSESVTVKQAAKNAIVVAVNEYNVSHEGGALNFNVSSNVDFTVETDVNWITKTQTKSLETYPLSFSISENESTQSRAGHITIKSGDLKQVITVIQHGTNAELILEKKECTISSDAQEIEVVVTSNTKVSYKIGSNWIQAVTTKASSTNKYVFKISENTSYDPREGKIVFSTESGSASETFVVKQSAKGAIVVAVNEYKVGAEATSLNFNVSSNVDFTVDTDVDWVTRTQTKGLESYPLSFSIDANKSTQSRTGHITVKSGSLKQVITVIQSGANATLTLEKNDCTVSSSAQDVEVIVSSNTKVTYVIGPNWIQDASTTNGTTNKYVFKVSENTSYDSREGEIVFQSEDKSASATFVVKQSAKNAIVVAVNEYKVNAEAGSLNFDVSANVNFTVETDVNWMRRTQTKGLETYPLSFAIDSNESTQERTGHITVKSGDLKQVITVIQSGKASYYLSLATELQKSYSWKMNEIDVNLNTNIPLWDLDIDVSPKLDGIIGGLYPSVMQNGILLSLIDSQDDAHVFTVTISPRDKSIKVDPLVLTVNQEAHPDFHVLKDFLTKCNPDNVAWRPGKPLTTFDGVWRNEEGRVYAIMFYGNKAEFTCIPESIADLSELEMFAFNGEKIGGTIPTSIKKLTKVKSIQIQETSLVGPIPDVFQNWNSLIDCAIACNPKLDGPLPKSLGSHTSTINIQLPMNMFTGSIPEEWLNKPSMRFFDLSENRLSGQIPPAFFKINGFEKYLVDLLRQQKGYVFDFSNIDEFPGYYSRELMTGYDGKTFKIEDVIKKNKYTVQLYWATWCPFSKALMPQLKEFYEKYHSSGFEIIAMAPLDFQPGMTMKQLDDLVKKEIDAKGFGKWYNVSLEKSDIGNYPMAVPHAIVYDSKGNIVFTAENAIDPGRERFSRITSAELIPFLEDKFGVLDDTPLYESKDFSKDGEVVTLQKATSGKGINIVFMGDGFVDKDMSSGGVYETMMKKSMDEFFALEPYKTFRNRFNVYAVKAVSKNNKIGEDYDTALSTYLGVGSFVSGNSDKCFEYAQKVPTITNKKDLLIVTLVNSKSSHGTTHMFPEDGSAVAYATVVDGDFENIGHMIRHEAAGHGFAMLADEYGGNEEIPISVKESYQESAKKYGIWANVDFTSDAKNIKWKKYLEDSRYKNLVGIYEGGATYDEGVWRPTENSMMRDNMEWFNAPSREAIYKRIMTLSGETYSWEEFVKYDEINRTTTKSSARPTSAKVPYKGHAPIVY